MELLRTRPNSAVDAAARAPAGAGADAIGGNGDLVGAISGETGTPKLTLLVDETLSSRSGSPGLLVAAVAGACGAGARRHNAPARQTYSTKGGPIERAGAVVICDI